MWKNKKKKWKKKICLQIIIKDRKIKKEERKERIYPINPPRVRLFLHLQCFTLNLQVSSVGLRKNPLHSNHSFFILKICDATTKNRSFTLNKQYLWMMLYYNRLSKIKNKGQYSPTKHLNIISFILFQKIFIAWYWMHVKSNASSNHLQS